MTETPAQSRYRADALLLAEIGAHVTAQTPSVPVRMPARLARAAAQAWGRDELDPPGPESGEQAYVRAFAAALALIGLAAGEAEAVGEEVVVHLDPGRLAAAIFAHECAADAVLRGQPGEASPVS
ncbi:hypothetical protein [Actinoplanes flavus]|uniref:Uncharacterized protein n=1 Tax=Actinoplanes flavus TaxID=2820290 RepID=A0ABS3UIR9_9ACTN|nr:hypothetical protein [Actinoplanes flavus]MBO3738683.1 hypothetical protein [Actinoplanes flavus]